MPGQIVLRCFPLPPRGYSDTASIEIFGCKALISARKNIFGSCRFPRVHCIFWLPMKRQHRGLCNLVWGTIEPLRGALSLSLSLSLPLSVERGIARTAYVTASVQALVHRIYGGLGASQGTSFPHMQHCGCLQCQITDPHHIPRLHIFFARVPI
jgi:hypothetical protein